MKHIIIPIDFSDHSLAAAELGMTLAARMKTQVTLLHALDLWAHISIPPKVWDRYKTDQIASSHRHLGKVKDDLQRTHGDVPIKLLVRSDEPSHAILTHASEIGAGLIVMASYGANAGQRFLLGSVASRVARRAPCPVLVTRKDHVTHIPRDARFHQPLIAVDYSRFSRPAVRLATELSAPDASLELIHIFQWPGAHDDGKLAEELAAARTAEMTRLQEFASHLDIAPVRVAFRTEIGTVASQILSFIGQSKTDLVVVGAHGRQEEIPHLGTVADRLLRASPVPVALVPEACADRILES